MCKVFKLDTLGLDFLSGRAKKSYKLGYDLQSIHKFRFMSLDFG